MRVRLLLVLLLGVTVAYLCAGVAFAQEASVTTQKLELENYLPCNPSASCSPISNNSRFSGDSGVRMHGDGNLTVPFTTAGQPTSVTVKMAAATFYGAPQMAVKVDGTNVQAEQEYNTSGRFDTFTFSIPSTITGTSHTLELVGSNMGASGGTRSLIFDYVDIAEEDTAEDFSDDFERDPDTFVPPWQDTIQCDASDLITSTDVARTGSYSAKFTVANDDNGEVKGYDVCKGGNANPRAQMYSDHIFSEGSEHWIGTSIYIPSDFPIIPNKFATPTGSTNGDGWAILGGQGFGEDTSGIATGGAPLDYYIDSINGVNYLIVINKVRNASGGDDHNIVWRTPLVQGQWLDLTFHEVFSVDPQKGYVEVYYGAKGQPQTLQTLLTGNANDRTRFYTETLKNDQGGKGRLIRTFYHAAGMPGFENDVTVYQDDIKVSTVTP